MSTNPAKLDQLVAALLQAVEDRINVARADIVHIVDIVEGHREELLAWQRQVEANEQAMAARVDELTRRLDALVDGPVGSSSAPIAAAAETIAPATTTPAGVVAPPVVVPPVVVTQPVVVTPVVETHKVDMPVTAAAPTPAPLVGPAAVQPDTSTSEAAPAPAAAPASESLDIDVLTRLIEEKLQGWDAVPAGAG
jgi:hypothetical protein